MGPKESAELNSACIHVAEDRDKWRICKEGNDTSSYVKSGEFNLRTTSMSTRGLLNSFGSNFLSTFDSYIV